MTSFLPSTKGILKPWSPRNLAGIYQWFDAQDLASITKDGSNNVTQWNDKSGNAGHMTATGTAGPTYVASSINTRPALTFGPNKGLSNTTAFGLDFLRAQNAVTVMMVLEHITLIQSAIFYFWSTGTSAGSGRMYISDNSNGRLTLSMRQLDADSRYDDLTSAIYPLIEDTPMIFRQSLDIANQKPYMYLNEYGDTTDIENSTPLATANAFSNTRSLDSEFGGGPGLGADGAEYKIGELILTRSVMSAREIASVNAYLRNKWGIE